MRAVVAVGLTAGLLIGCAGDGGRASGEPRVLQPGAPGETNREVDPGATPGEPDSEGHSHTPADVRFMQQMLPHHRQALEMTALVPDRTGRDDIALLSARIETSQAAEIELIERWLTARGESIPTDHHLHSPASSMPGMLTRADLDALERATGTEFDQLFLQRMIHHHEGALIMVADLFEQGGGLEPETLRFAEDVDADQRIEISRMEAILRDLTNR